MAMITMSRGFFGAFTFVVNLSFLIIGLQQIISWVENFVNSKNWNNLENDLTNRKCCAIIPVWKLNSWNQRIVRGAILNSSGKRWPTPLILRERERCRNRRASASRRLGTRERPLWLSQVSCGVLLSIEFYICFFVLKRSGHFASDRFDFLNNRQ